jgi:hypothetical protein
MCNFKGLDLIKLHVFNTSVALDVTTLRKDTLGEARLGQLGQNDWFGQWVCPSMGLSISGFVPSMGLIEMRIRQHDMKIMSHQWVCSTYIYI